MTNNKQNLAPPSYEVVKGGLDLVLRCMRLENTSLR